MAHESGGGDGAMRDLKWLIGILIVAWFLWYFAIGPNRQSSEKPFIEPAQPLGTGATYGPK